MNVTCTGCPAKYAVPDEKVRGKKVRITCKHCGTNIVVDGTAVDTHDDVLPKPAAQPAAPALASVPTAASHASAKAAVEAKAPVAAKLAAVAEVMFIVGFPDDRQQPHTVSQIVEMYSAGQIDDEALVWKDGMADWLSPFDVPELAAAFRAKNVAPRAPAFSPTAEDEATLVVRSPLEDPEVAAAIAAAKAPAPVAAPTPVAAPAPVALAASPKPAEESMFGKPAAARRVEKRAGAVDLFGGVAEAGSEGDVSLDLGSSDEPAQKLTGARNESSVLFSLDALTKPDPKANKAKERARDEEASAVLFGESAPDSLMNLGNAGLGGAMAAPDFTKPVSAVAQAARPIISLEAGDAPVNKGRGGVLLLVGFVSIAAVAAVAFVMMQKHPISDPVITASSATPVTASAAASTNDAPTASNAALGSAAPTASNAPAASGSSAAAQPSAAAAGSGAPVAAGASAASTKPATASATPPASPAASAASAGVSKPAEPAASPKPAEAAAPAAAEGAAFDKNAAVAALGAAAASAGSCKTADGPTGSGKVSVTFAPSGRATATSVAGELAGTEVGGCVARLFRSAKVPPFSGDPVTVSKSFTVQ